MPFRPWCGSRTRHADAGKAGKAQEKIGLAGYLNTLRSLEMKERNAGGLYDNIRAVYRAEVAVPADKFDIRLIIYVTLSQKSSMNATA